MNKTLRAIIGSIILFIIITILIILFVRKEWLFTEKTEKIYPDGCVEKYVNGIATTPICSHGRVMQTQGEYYEQGTT